VPHPSNVGQSRLRPVEVSPLVEQVDAVAPAFDLLAAPEPPMVTGAELGDGQAEVVRPDEERREGIDDQLRAWEMLSQHQHQRLNLRLLKVHQDAFGQKEKGMVPKAMCTHCVQPGAVER
jgi:hypothetical protein